MGEMKLAPCGEWECANGWTDEGGTEGGWSGNHPNSPLSPSPLSQAGLYLPPCAFHRTLATPPPLFHLHPYANLQFHLTGVTPFHFFSRLIAPSNSQNHVASPHPPHILYPGFRGFIKECTVESALVVISIRQTGTELRFVATLCYTAECLVQ